MDQDDKVVAVGVRRGNLYYLSCQHVNQVHVSDAQLNAKSKEIRSIKANEVWELAELPKRKKTIGCKWIYKRKVGVDGSVEKYKARLVAKGYSQQYKLDYETFSPVARFKSLQTLLVLAEQNGLHVHKVDLTTAFLNERLKEEVCMDQPEDS